MDRGVARTVVVPGVEGDLAGELWMPASGQSFPAVVVLAEVDGFNEGTRAAARRLATAGYVALALDLYAPLGRAPVLRSGADTVAWLGRLDDRRQLSDLASAVAWLRHQPSVDAARIGAVGFSIGGRYAMLLGAEPHDLAAVVSFYTRPWPGGSVAETALAPGDRVDALATPVCAIFGSEDELIPRAMVAEFDRLLAGHPDAGHQVHVVPGRHYFANPSRSRRYLASSEAEAWGYALDFLTHHLGS